MKTIYGWQDGEGWFLSRRPKADNGPRNRYGSREDALRAAEARNLIIEWQ